MKQSIVVFALTCAWLAPAAGADCYACVNQCCEEAAEGTSGKEVCTNDYFCFAGVCDCNDCITQGTTCEGTGSSSCDNPNGICEEHQSSFTVPNGSPIDPNALLTPKVLEAPAPTAIGVCRST